MKLGSGWQTPSGVAVDAAGNVYVADEVNTFVTELPWNGSGYGAAVQVGSGLSSPRWPAVDGIGNLYISDAGNGRVVKEPYTTGGFGTQTTVLGALTGVAYPLASVMPELPAERVDEGLAFRAGFLRCAPNPERRGSSPRWFSIRRGEQHQH